ncbi:MAG TPA: hypothetical protein VIZ58_12105, partial [Thermoanaerobaculia bacterium]
TGIETSVNELYQEVARALDFTGKPESAPLPPGEQRRSVLDSTRIRRDFQLPDWTPLAQGIPETARYFRDKVAAEKAARLKEDETAPARS